MIIVITELCEVDYIDEERPDDGPHFAKRIVHYDSDKDNLIDAFHDYDDHFDCDRILDCTDEFDGTCLNLVRYLKIEED